jgi:hypothetical protein
VPGPARHHPLAKQPSQHDRSAQIDGQDTVKLLNRVVSQFAGARHPSIGNKNVNVRANVGKPLKIVLIGQISNNRPPLHLSGERLKHVPTPPSERQHAPLSPQPPSNRLPKPTRSPSNENRPTAKFHGRMVIATPDKITRKPAVAPSSGRGALKPSLERRP